ncbi:hypothetical protein D3C78_1299440 [compost metagenome]
MLAVGEHLVLARQVGAAGVHQVDARQAVLLGDGLRADVLLHGQRVIGAAFYRGVVADDHAFHILDATDACDHASGGDVLAIHLMGGEGGKFEERRARVEQAVDALAHRQLAACGVLGDGSGAAAFVDEAEHRAEVVHLFEHGRGVGGELGRARVDLGVKDGHAGGSWDSCWYRVSTALVPSP